VAGNRAGRRQKSLGMTGGCEPLHTILALARGAMGMLTPVLEGATLPGCHPGQDLALGRAVALELIGAKHAWHILQPFEQLAQALLRRLLIPPALDQDIADVVVLVHGAPPGMTLPVDRPDACIQVPLVPWLGASPLQWMRLGLPKRPTPRADGLVGHIDTAFKEEGLPIAVASRQARVEPDAMPAELAGTAVSFVALGGSGWRPVGCLSGGERGL
jgi:hypothetical protein